MAGLAGVLYSVYITYLNPADAGLWTRQVFCCAACDCALPVRHDARLTRDALKKHTLTQRFGAAYESRCELDAAGLTALLDAGGSAGGGGTRFYEPFIRQTAAGADGRRALYPVPVRVASATDDGNGSGHVRRFFFADASLGSSASGGGNAAAAGARVLTYAAGLSLAVAARDDARDQIYPPVLTVT